MPRRPPAASVPPAAVPLAVPAVQRAPLFEGVQPDSDSDSGPPAVLISPVKARAAKRGIANKTDLEVWSLPDTEIIGEWLLSKKMELIQCIFRGFEIYLALTCLRSF
jgi:hypothetical protein